MEPLVKGFYYHIYNRGVNKEKLFRGTRDYLNFLNRYAEAMHSVAETLAYNLLGNHFHFLVYLKEDTEVEKKGNKGKIVLDAAKQLGHVFNGHAQYINQKYGRCGSLFESPFKRKCVDDEKYLTSLLYYIHNNAQYHGFVGDFRQWPWTSYHAVLNPHDSIINKQWVLDWFGGIDGFLSFHAINSEWDVGKYCIE